MGMSFPCISQSVGQMEIQAWWQANPPKRCWNDSQTTKMFTMTALEARSPKSLSIFCCYFTSYPYMKTESLVALGEEGWRLSVSRIHPLGTVDICAKFQRLVRHVTKKPHMSNSWWGERIQSCITVMAVVIEILVWPKWWISISTAEPQE